MLTMYLRVPQEGIEPLDNPIPPIKNKESGHFYFDDFRITLQYHWNAEERCSGLAILSFGPNGSLWSETGEHCRSLDEVSGYYFGVELGMEEAEKSQAKRVTICIPNKKVVTLLNSETAFKDENYHKIHEYIMGLTTKFESVQFVFRDTYPGKLNERLVKEAKLAAEPPQFGINGYYLNAPGKSYSNIDMDEKEMRFAAEQYAHLLYNLQQSHMKDLREEYGDDKFSELVKGINSGEIKSLPKPKKYTQNEKKTIFLKKYKTPNKAPVKCHHCDGVMKAENARLEKPSGEQLFKFRCDKCWSTKTLNGKGRLIQYGRHPKK